MNHGERVEDDLAAAETARMLVGLRGRFASAGGIHHARPPTSPANTRTFSHSRNGRGPAQAPPVSARKPRPRRSLWCCTPARAMAMTDAQRRCDAENGNNRELPHLGDVVALHP